MCRGRAIAAGEGSMEKRDKGKAEEEGKAEERESRDERSNLCSRHAKSREAQQIISISSLSNK